MGASHCKSVKAKCGFFGLPHSPLWAERAALAHLYSWRADAEENPGSWQLFLRHFQLQNPVSKQLAAAPLGQRDFTDGNMAGNFDEAEIACQWLTIPIDCDYDFKTYYNQVL